FKLTAANPSFLDARDAILRALDDKRAAGQLTQAEFDTARNGAWAAFAKFGMGPNARSNGATLSEIVADFNFPQPVSTTPPTVKVESSPNQAIPDNNSTGITSVLSVTNDGRIKRLTVSVDILHTFIGDLLVTLVTPTGKTAVLHARAGGSQNNLVSTFRSEDIPSLAALLGDQAKGDWRLQVADLANADVGTLRRWGLEMKLEATTQAMHQESTPGLSIPDN